jgi:hypothetical protein
MANIAPLLQYLDIPGMRGAAAAQLTPWAQTPPPMQFSGLSQDMATMQNARADIGAQPPRYQPPLPIINQPINPPPLPWFAYAGGQALPPNDRIPAPPQRPGMAPPVNVTAQSQLPQGDFNPQQPPAQVEVDEQMGSGMDPRYGIQQGTDQGFGSYQPSAADFGEKQAQQQSAGMSDAGMWGLLAAGLGILANNYGNYGQAAPAIGKGGMMGLQTFLGERQVQERNKFAQQELDQRKEQVGINRQVMEGQLAAQQRAAALAQRRDGLLEKFRGTKDPNEKMAIMEELALLSDSDAAFGAVMRAKNGSKKYIKGRVGIPGQPDMQREVLIDPETMTPVWQGDPMKKGALVHVDASDKTESKFGEKYGGAQGERANAIEQMADKAASQLHQTNVMYDVAKQWRQSGGQLGAAGDIQALATGAIQAIGGDPTRLGLPKDAGPAQTLEAISNTFVLSKIGGEGGMPANNFSNADLQFLQATKPRVANTPEGFVLTLMLERGAARRAMQMDEMFQNELDAFPPDQERRAYRSFRRKWQEFVNNNSAWTPEEMAEIKAMKKGLGAKEGAAPSGARKYNPETGRIE